MKTLLLFSFILSLTTSIRAAPTVELSTNLNEIIQGDNRTIILRDTDDDRDLTSPSTEIPSEGEEAEIQEGQRKTPFTEANAQAIYWLNMVDNRQYGASWLAAGGALRDLITQDQWSAGLKAYRDSLGSVSVRKVARHNTSQSLRYGTKGSFMTIKYKTSFSRRPNLVETIILMTEEPLQLWRVIGYSIGSR